MSGKRNKKSIVNASLINNNVKKSKNIGTTDVYFNANDSIKSRKKQNVNTSQNENKVVVGTKRKLSLPDNGISPSSKKTKKKGKLLSNMNSSEDVHDSSFEVSTPSSNFDVEKQKKSKRKKTSVESDELCVSKNNSIDTNDESDHFVQKVGKKKSKLKKSAATDDVNMLIKTEIIENGNSLIHPKKEMYSTLHDEVKLEDMIKNEEIDGEMKYYSSDLNDSELLPELITKPGNSGIPKKEVFNWPEEDLRKLVERMEVCIPENDTLAFGTRAEKLEWSSIAFKEYSVEDCKTMWFLLQKQIRRFRLLKEVLEDAKEWINAPKSRKKKGFRHPDLPRKPLSAYFIYYLQKKDVFHRMHPGLDATEISKMLGQEFKNLPPEKRLKYENLAAKQKIEYLKKLDEFYQLHPEIPRIVKTQRIKPGKKPKLPKPVKEKLPKPQKERIPKRPPPPFHYFYLSGLQEEEVEDKLTFKEICKERWKQLPDDKKVVFINMAETEYAKYEEALSKYSKNHPERVQNHHKPILTKEELQIKDRVAGKPIKPPGSAYNLYVRELLQSEEIKNVPIRDRLNYVSNQWKSCPEETKKYYRDLSAELNDEYKAKYATYLEGLPEEERKLELQKNVPKRRKSEAVETQKIVKKEKKEKPVKKKVEKKAPEKKFLELEQPPISAFKYFASLYTGSEAATQAWKALSAEEKKVYEDELTKKKQAYIVDFEKFLKSLSKEELEEFSNSRKKSRKEPEEDEEEDEEEEASSGDSGTGESDVESSDEADN